jgi:glycosyltransferase involved in cell wall biosynthesis
VRIVIDYRPALRARTGVGEYIHQVTTALARAATDDITIFSSSWKDRPARDLATELPGVRIVDQRIPVRALNLAWHRLGWPPVETVVGGTYDVAHSPHPLLLPSRSAAQIVTIHDVHFITHPERTSREIRRDYPTLAMLHARRADRIIVSSRFARGEVVRLLNVPAEKIAVCPAGAPEWTAPPATGANDGYVLFVGTLEPRKNIGGLLEAYGRLLARVPKAPRLVIAGEASSGAEPWLDAMARPPLSGHVEYLGYVPADRREALFKGAQLFVLPSFEEGFGLAALEAMAAGIPIVASNRGSIPEVVGDAGILIEPDDPEQLTQSMERIISDTAIRVSCARRGLELARRYSWTQTALDVRRAYEDALIARQQRMPALSHAYRD